MFVINDIISIQEADGNKRLNGLFGWMKETSSVTPLIWKRKSTPNQVEDL